MSGRLRRMSRNRTKEERPLQPIKKYVLWLLSRREYSAKQLRARLKLKGYAAEEIEDALTLMQTYNYQSDERFAESVVRSGSARLGDRSVQAKLAASGVDDEITATQLSQLAPEADRARALVERFEGKLLDEQLRAKVWRHLAYRGFSSNSIRQAIFHLAELAKEREPSDD